jgi:hypothetical protein
VKIGQSAVTHHIRNNQRRRIQISARYDCLVRTFVSVIVLTVSVACARPDVQRRPAYRPTPIEAVTGPPLEREAYEDGRALAVNRFIGRSAAGIRYDLYCPHTASPNPLVIVCPTSIRMASNLDITAYPSGPRFRGRGRSAA